jgi:hypothetical protein
MTKTIHGTQTVPMVHGTGWTFTHNGADYEMVHVAGSDTVRLYVRTEHAGWEFGHARLMNARNGLTAHVVALYMHADVTAPVGTDYARQWLVEHGAQVTGTFDRERENDVRALTNNGVQRAIAREYPGGWNGMLRAIGASN